MKKGKLTVIAGCMFSGKTTELLRIVGRSKYADLRVGIFKPSIDNRFSSSEVVSHSGLKENATSVKAENPQHILDHIHSANLDLVAIEEVQFFSEKIIDVINQLLVKGINVVVCGLDLNFRGEPFGVVPTLMALSDEVKKLKAVCMADGCRNDAIRTQRIIDGEPASKDGPTLLVGEKDFYEARCRDCYIVPV